MAGFIFPTSGYGQTGFVGGTNITAYANSQGFPAGSGLVLGAFGVLFDGSICKLLKANAGITQFQAVTPVLQGGVITTVTPTTAALQLAMGTNDRAGSTALVANNIAWFTCYGVGTVLVNASTTAGAPLATTTTAGQLGVFTPGTSVFDNVLLLNTTTSAGSYPVLFI